MTPTLTKTITLDKAPDIAALHEIAVAHTEERYHLHGAIQPTWLVASGKNVGFIETDFDDPILSKEFAAYIIRETLKRYRCQAYSFISEVWQATFRSDEERLEWTKHVDYHGVSSLPPHMVDDVALVMSHDRAGTHMLTKFLVTLRPPNKGLNFLGPRMDESDQLHGIAGRMFNLFEPEIPIDSDIRADFGKR